MASNYGRDQLISDGILLLLDGQELFGETSGSWPDQSGNNNHVQLCNNVISSSGTGMYFESNPDSGNDAFGQIAHNGTLSPANLPGSGSTKGMTFSGVMEYGDNPDASNGGWFCSSGGGSNFPFHLGRPNGTTKIKFFFGDNGSFHGITGGTNIGTDTKVSFCALHDEAGRQELYINGVIDASAANGITQFYTNNYSYILGAQGYQGNPMGNMYTDTTIHQLIVYNRPFTAAEIQHNYEVQRDRYNL